MTGASVALRIDTDIPVRETQVCPDSVAGSAIPFWQTLHEGKEGFLCLLSGFRIGRTLHGITQKYWQWPDERLQAASWVAREASYGRDVYQTPYLHLRPKLHARHGAYVVAADLDDASLEGLPAPTVVVETSPRRRQAYWTLTEPISASIADRLSLRIQRMAGVSPSVPHFLRVPGIPNRKYHGVSVTTKVDERTFKPGQFAALLGLDPKTLRSFRDAPGVLDWIRQSPTLTSKALRGAVAGVGALVLTLGSVGLRGSADPIDIAIGSSKIEERNIVTSTSPEAKLAYVNLGMAPTIEVSSRRPATPARTSETPTAIQDEVGEVEPSENPVGQAASDEFDMVRRVGQAIFDIRDELR